MSVTLMSYNQEIVPKFIALNTAKQILKEGIADDTTVQKIQQEIKDLQESVKAYIEDKESELVREIKDLETDIKLAVAAAAKGTPYKNAELKAFFAARAKQSVEKVVGRGELFSELEKEIS